MRQSPTPRGDSRERAHGHRRAARPDTHVSHDSVRSRRVDRVSREADAASRGRGEAHGHEASKPRRSPREVVTSAASFVRGHRIPFIVMGVVLLVAASLYGPARDAYVSTRKNEDLQTLLTLEGQRNDALQDDVSRLQSREGVEDAARERGWVYEGETSATVEGLEDDELDPTQKVSYQDNRDQKTKVLDFIFGYDPTEVYE